MLDLCVQFLLNAFTYIHSTNCRMGNKEILKMWEVSEKYLKCSKKERESVCAYLLSLLQKSMTKKELRKLWPGEKIEPSFEQFLAQLPEPSEIIKRMESYHALFTGFMVACLEQPDPEFMGKIAERAREIAEGAGCTKKEISEACAPILRQCRTFLITE